MTRFFKRKNKSSQIKAIAFYLPQYHRVPENDKWWGEGFTDWCAVRRADSLFEGHKQPRVPKMGYYNLLSKKTLQWQAELVKKAGLHGLCFYHYWFKDGKKILEKPAELLLKEKEIDMNYCFSWANESWIRTWSNIPGDVWADKYEKSEEKNSEGVLLKKDYGKIEDWKEHFEYLLPFFRDERYIKYEGKPVFIIYNAEIGKQMKCMLSCWKRWAVEVGFSGLYIIGMIHENKMRCNIKCDAELLHNPTTGFNEMQPNIVNDIELYDYDKFWRYYLNIEKLNNRKRYLCGIVDHDTTPRKGKKGRVIVNASPNKFNKYFKRLVKKSINEKNEFIFINAWNEWGESMYLEPDEEYGYEYIKATGKALS